MISGCKQKQEKKGQICGVRSVIMVVMSVSFLLSVIATGARNAERWALC